MQTALKHELKKEETTPLPAGVLVKECKEKRTHNYFIMLSTSKGNTFSGEGKNTIGDVLWERKANCNKLMCLFRWLGGRHITSCAPPGGCFNICNRLKTACYLGGLASHWLSCCDVIKCLWKFSGGNWQKWNTERDRGLVTDEPFIHRLIAFDLNSDKDWWWNYGEVEPT